MKPDLTSRSLQSELMDAADVDTEQLGHALSHLARVNQLLNGYSPSLTGIAKLLPPDCRQFSLLDVGCGSADTLRRIARWARAEGIQCQLTGIELSSFTAAKAAEQCVKYPEIQVQSMNLFELPNDSRFDIVHCALVLHHFKQDRDVINALRKMFMHSKLGIVINDLHRHWFAYHSIALLTRIFSRSPILHNDAPLSVARGFSREELLKYSRSIASSFQVAVRWHWAFRWLMIVRK